MSENPFQQPDPERRDWPELFIVRILLEEIQSFAGRCLSRLASGLCRRTPNMQERRFPDGVILELPEGFVLVDITTLSDALPRTVVSVDIYAPLLRKILESINPKEAE